jgi:hypothetical protein
MLLSSAVLNVAKKLEKEAEVVSSLSMKEVMNVLERHYVKKYKPEVSKKLKALRFSRSKVDLVWE